MRVSLIDTVNFKGKIIDSHAHIGSWVGKSYGVNSLDKFIKQPLENGDVIDKMVVSSLSCLEKGASEIEGNMEVLQMAKSNDKIIPLISCEPNNGSVHNIIRLFNENEGKFYGLKFHPDGSRLIADDVKYHPYLKFAQKKNLPCLFHCGINWDGGEFVAEKFRYSVPKRIYEAAKTIPNTPVIMAHMGAGGERVHKIALDTLIESVEKGDAKLYADISWVDCATDEKPNIINAIKILKNTSKGDMTERLLFGSDIPIGEFDEGFKNLSGTEYYKKTIEDIKRAIKENFDDGDEIIDKIFYKNAESIFLKNKEPKTNFLKKAAPIAFLGIAAFACAAVLLKRNKNKEKEAVLKPSLNMDSFLQMTK